MNVHAEASISAPFGDFFELLRTCGLKVGATEWMAFLRAMRAGVIGSTPELYALGRAILCRSEADYDAFDMAFSAAFQGAEIPQDYFDKLRDWLEDAAFPHDPDRPWTQEDRDLEALWKDFLKTLAEQQERHDGGGRWVGTGGTSPFGHSGYASQGIRVGGPGGGRRALAVAGERRWRRYRNDRQYGVRDFQVALRALRDLGREGHLELDLDETIRETGRNGGEIELVERRARQNRIHLLLLLDSGGSMAPHASRVTQLFSAAARLGNVRSLQAYAFHNCIYDALWDELGDEGRVTTDHVLQSITAHHRVIFVGDACMAPYELVTPRGWPPEHAVVGLEQLRRFRRRAPHSVWLNPEPRAYWSHPTIRTIGAVFPMQELTLEGLRAAVEQLRASTNLKPCGRVESG